MLKKIIFFLSVYFIASTVGLYVGWNSIPQIGEVNPITGRDIADPFNSLMLILWILVSTAMLLLVLKYYKGRILFRLLEVFMIFIGSQIFYGFLFADFINGSGLGNAVSQEAYEALVMIIAAATVILRLKVRRYGIQNITLAVTVGSIGGFLGATMGFYPALLLVIGLSCYDFIAVFMTKHMIDLADASRARRLPVMFETSAKGIKTGPRRTGIAGKGGDVLGLGTGDVAIPLVFFVAILRDLTVKDMLFAYVGAIIGLALTIYYVTNVRRMALPALPPIIGCSLLALWIGMMF